MCRGCGTRKEEWARDRDAYVGHIEQCPGCERLEQEQAHVRSASEEKGMLGLRAGLVPRALAETLDHEETGV